MRMEGVRIVVLLVTVLSCVCCQKFPEDFLFGVGGAAYEIEGAWNEDGKGLSIWDNFTHQFPEKMADNSTGDIACDSYHKIKEDIAILKYLGVKLYRLSISWPRILPNGTPYPVNQLGIDYYRELLKELVANDIEPIVTLYHWDLPQYLEDLGGWLNPQIADYFGHFARIVFQNLGPYVKYWTTINEISTTCGLGYGSGDHAPGKTLIGDGFYQCTYTSLKAHARAWRIYDEEFRASQGGKIGLNFPADAFYPKTNSIEDIEAAERLWEFDVGLFANPVYLGNWPQLAIDRIANRSALEGYSFSRLPKFTQDEIDYIKGTSDYFLVNPYTSNYAEDAGEAPIQTPSFYIDRAVTVSYNESWTYSASDWLRSDPPGIRFVLNYLNTKYQPGEFIITENGWSDTGGLDDEGRITYHKGYLQNVLDAILEDGIKVTGYAIWSLLDNFAWNAGYTVRFGLVQVDFDSPNRTRTLKKSAEWYKRVIAARAIVD